MKAFTWGLFLLILGWVPARGQGLPNPFDLTPRLTPAASADSAPGSVKGMAWQTGNPFDVAHAVAPVSPDGSKPKGLAKKVKPERPIRSPEEQYKTFLFAITVSLLAILTILITVFRPVYQRVYRGFINENILNQIHRESQSVGALPYYILYGLFFLIAGTFVFLTARYFGAAIPGNLWQGWLFCVGAMTMLFLAKHAVLSYIGAIFPVEKETGAYNFTIMVFGIMLGLALLPANVLIAYGPTELMRPAIFVSFGIIGLVYAFRSLRGLFLANNFLAAHKLHFFLYLCTVEIAPVLVLVKLIQNQV